jgi:uncharacterized protein
MSRVVLACLCCAVSVAASAQSPAKGLTGAWLGRIGGSVPVILHFATDPSGETKGAMDSPQQGAMGLPFTKVRVFGDSLVCLLTVPQATYAAVRTSDSSFVGSWIQGPTKVVLEIRRARGAADQAYVPPRRPQTPLPPFPYKSDSVEYDNTARTVHLGATLTYPSSGSRFPVAVLITGSGIQDRDETIFSHKPFAVIADYLTRRGYAVLRVDDRSAGVSTGDVIDATSADFARDVETSLAYLRTRKEIDTTRMGLIGHSEGGMIAPMIAARDKRIAFIILLAGPAESGYSTLMYQTLKPLQHAKASDRYISYSLLREKIILENIVAAKNEEALVYGIDSAYQALYTAYRDSGGNAMPGTIPPEQFKTIIARQAPVLVGNWWKFFITYDSDTDYHKLTCPVLALGGDKDIQVNNAVDLETMDSLVSRAERSRLETHLLPGLNHLFQHCHTCTVDEYAKLEETFSPEALKLMGDWLDAHVR